MRPFTHNALYLLLFLALLCLPVAAEDETTDTGWKDSAELAIVMTGGNAEASTFNLKNELSRAWDQSNFILRLGGLRTESTSRTNLFGIDDGINPITIIETTVDETTAENYFLNAVYEQKITDSFFWTTGAGWDRNTFAGIKNRYQVFGGVGNIWFNEDDHKFSTSYGLTYTKQDDVVDNPLVSDSYLGLRASWDYERRLSQSSTMGNTLVLNLNVDDTDDWRADTVFWLAVEMSERMALKVSYTLLYDNMPSLETFNIYDDNLITNPGALLLGTDTREKDELDTIFAAALVINF
jgi:hypothetical protein